MLEADAFPNGSLLATRLIVSLFSHEKSAIRWTTFGFFKSSSRKTAGFSCKISSNKKTRQTTPSSPTELYKRRRLRAFETFWLCVAAMGAFEADDVVFIVRINELKITRHRRTAALFLKSRQLLVWFLFSR